jgi:hypothetical protein
VVNIDDAIAIKKKGALFHRFAKSSCARM